MLASLFLEAAFWPLTLISILVSTYLLILAVASLWPERGRTNNRSEQLTRFAVIVPAHDEQVLLPELLSSLKLQNYPAELFTIIVIADNCSDQTASVARLAGAQVYERNAPDAPGKGQALRWLFDQMLEQTDVDAYAFIDADSSVDANFLFEMNLRIAGGATVLQSSYRVSDATSHALVSLRALAFSLIHDLRGRGKERLGLSIGLWGNGMVMTREVVHRIPWGSFSAVEDAEQHLLIVLTGSRAEFVSTTHVYGYMPSTFKHAKDQQRRWEGGRQSLIRTHGWRLLSAAMRRRSKILLASCLDIVLPPTSVVLILSLAVLSAGFWVGGSGLAAALIGTVELASYVAVGFLTSGLPPKVYLSILYAPFYIVWKTWLFACQLPKKTGPAWLPTSRNS